MQTRCAACPLRKLSLFQSANREQIDALQRFKTGELEVDAGSQLLTEDASSAHLFTVLRGMGVRSKGLATGARQVTNFVLPGDFVGLQSGVMNVMGHSVYATTSMRLCVFNRSDLWSLFRNQPELAFDMTHLAAREEHVLSQALTSVGQLDAVSRLAWLLHLLFHRLTALELASNSGVPLPYRQRDVADALGLSLVHTNKSLAKLRAARVLDWSDGRLVVYKEAELARIGHVSEVERPLRPLI